METALALRVGAARGGKDGEEDRPLEIRRRPRRRNPLRGAEDASSRARDAPCSLAASASAAPSPRRSTPDSGREAAAAAAAASARPGGAGSSPPRPRSPSSDDPAAGRHRGVATPVRSRRAFNRSRPVPARGRDPQPPQPPPPPQPSSPWSEDPAWDDPFGFAAAERALRSTLLRRSAAPRPGASDDKGRPRKPGGARAAGENATAPSPPPATSPSSEPPRRPDATEATKPPSRTEDGPPADVGQGESENVAPPRGTPARRPRRRKADGDGAPDEARLTSLDYVAMLPERKKAPPAGRKGRQGGPPERGTAREAAKKAEREAATTTRQQGGDQGSPLREVSRAGRASRRREMQIGPRAAAVAAEPAQNSHDEEGGAMARSESERKRKYFEEIDRFQLEEELIV